MKNIILTILILILIFVVIKCNKENFTSGKRVDSQKMNILQSFIKSNTNDFCAKANDEGLFVIESEYFRDEKDEKNDKKYFMYIDNSKSKKIQDIFKFRDSNIKLASEEKKADVDMKEMDDFKIEKADGQKKKIEDRKSNTRIDNGIWISIDDKDNANISKKKDGFKFRKFIRYTDQTEHKCDKNYQDKKRFLCRQKYFIRDLEIVQVYDNEKKEEVRYMLKYQGKYLYVSKKDTEDEKSDIKDINLFEEILVLKQLDMDMICANEGEYEKNDKNEFIKEKDTYEDIRFNRTYRDIPLKNMCPKEYPYACSLDYRYWRNVCTKNNSKDDYTGPGPSPETIEGSGLCNKKDIENSNEMRISKDNIPMRNFNCNGFRCLKKKEFGGNHPLNADLPGDKPLTTGSEINKYNYINLDGSTSSNNNYDTDGNNLNLVNFNNEYCINPEKYIDDSKIAGIHIEKFLFNIYPFEGNVKETVSSLSELSFLYEFPVVKRSDLTLDYFLDLGIKNGLSSCDTNEVPTINMADLGLGPDDKFRLCGTKETSAAKKKEGIIELKLKDLDDTCDDIVESGKMPQNWQEAKFEDKIVGCFTAKNNTSFSLDNFNGIGAGISDSTIKKNSLSECNNNQNYTALIDGTCYNFDKIPLFLKKQKLSQCNNTKATDTDKKFIGYSDSETGVHNFVIHKNLVKNKIDNFRSDRIYNKQYYKIFNKKLGIKYTNNDRDFLGGVKESVNDNFDPLDSIRFEKVKIINDGTTVIETDTKTPLKYTNQVILSFNNNDGTPMYITDNPITGHEGVVLSRKHTDTQRDILFNRVIDDLGPKKLQSINKNFLTFENNEIKATPNAGYAEFYIPEGTPTGFLRIDCKTNNNYELDSFNEKIPIYGSKDCKVIRETNPCKVKAFPRDKKVWRKLKFYFFRYGYSDGKEFGVQYNNFLNDKNIDSVSWFDYGNSIKDDYNMVTAKKKSYWRAGKLKYLPSYDNGINYFGIWYRPTVNIKRKISDYVLEFKLETNNNNKNQKLTYNNEQVKSYRGGIDVPVEEGAKIKLYYENNNEDGYKNGINEFNETQYLIYSPLIMNYSLQNNNITIDGKSIKGLHPYTGDKGNTGDGWDNHRGHKYHRLIRGILSKDFGNGTRHTNTDQNFLLEFSENQTFNNGVEYFAKHYYEKENGILPSRFKVQYRNKNLNVPDLKKKRNILSTKERDPFFIEKSENNYPFKLSNEKNDALVFEIVHVDDIRLDQNPNTNNSSRFVNIGNRDAGYQKIYLYNDRYKLYLSINDIEQNKNSFIILNQVEDKNEIITECGLNLNLAKTKEDIEKPKKVCYRKEPLQTVNIGNISAVSNGCKSNQFRMSEENINLRNSKYNFCTEENKVSTSMNNNNVNKIIKNKLSETKSYTPIPIQINNNNILN